MTKTERLYCIRKIIAEGIVGSQEELRRALARQGCQATQATLSRDLKDLGAAWVPGPRGGRYSLSAQSGAAAIRPFMGANITDISANETLVLIRTLPGAAGSVAEYIDSQKLPEALGTVAGDNTVLVIPSSVKRLAALQKILRDKLLGR